MFFEITKLPNFLEIKSFNRLRSEMNASLVDPIDNLIISVLTLDVVLRTTGQEVDIDDVEFDTDGTLTYKGRKVILYIRDFTYYSEDSVLPKFHVANCSTLQGMKRRKRFERYVVSTRLNGVFPMKISSDQQTWTDREESLDVCKNCLSQINWDNYTSSNKAEVFRKFSLGAFFEKYPNALITETPKFTDLNAPVNEYAPDVSKISKAYRSSVGWKCEQCSASLEADHLRRFLHVHHRNAIKSDNGAENLIALCISCHVNQDGHSHLKNSPDFSEYQKLRGRI